MTVLLLLAALADPSAQTHRYAEASERHVLDLYRPPSEASAELPTPEATPRPVLLFVHGGAWLVGSKEAVRSKTAFLDDGYAVASMNYRLLRNPLKPAAASEDPEVTVADQAADVAAAIDWLADHAAEHRLDAERIVLMGHSAGAHLVALVASDPQYLAVHDRTPTELAGVVLLDGAGYDVPLRMTDAQGTERRLFGYVFTNDTPTQTRWSPVTHASQHTTPPMLILHVADRRESTRQSERLAAAIRAGGSVAEVVPCPGKTHSSLNRELGLPGDQPTQRTRRFLLGIASQ